MGYNAWDIDTSKLKGKELYYYSYIPITIAANATAQQSISIDNDAEFLCTDFMGVALDAGLAITNNFTIQFREDTSGKFIQSNPTYSFLVLTNALTINPLPIYKLFSRKSTVSVFLGNLTPAPISIYITLRGYKIFSQS